MALKRRHREGSEAELTIKRRHLASTLGLNYGRSLQESVPSLEPIIRKWVQEAVDHAVGQFTRSSSSQVECSRSRSLQLQFHGTLASTLFTGNRIVTEDGSSLKVVLYDCTSKKYITSGPLSSVKVSIVVLDGDFDPGDREDWTSKEFDNKIVTNREGKRPLVTGELMVPLQDGVGCIGEVSFTDNSSWIRSGKFRLGAKVTNSDGIRIGEASSNAFKVKDHRGESYQKHYPPSLNDEVWRLKKIAKEGVSHKKLTQIGIFSVGDLLRLHATDHKTLRAVLHNVSDKTWDIVIAHAMKCTLDEQKYLYRTVQGTGLLFNSIYKVVGVTFDGETYHSANNLNIYQMRMVEDLKQHAYKNINDWISVSEPSPIGYPMLLASPAADACTNSILGHNVNFPEQGQHGMEIKTDIPTISPPYTTEVEQDNFCFELGESMRPIQSFKPTLGDSFGIRDSPGGIYIGGHHSWPFGGEYIGSQLSTDDPPTDASF